MLKDKASAHHKCKGLNRPEILLIRLSIVSKKLRSTGSVHSSPICTVQQNPKSAKMSLYFC